VAIVEGLIVLAHGLHSLYTLIEAAYSNPEISIALAAVLVGGIAGYIAIRLIRRNCRDFTSLR
jgi:hypothetical protein